MMIIGFCNLKGGVGKTTTVATIGAILASKGYKVLLIDLDSSRNLTISFMSEEREKNIHSALTGPKTATNLNGIIVHGEEFDNPVENLDLIPSSEEMTSLEGTLMTRLSRETYLQKVIRALNLEFKYDFILIDCPPSLGLTTVLGLTACTEVLIPTAPEVLPLEGLKQLERKLEQVAEELNPDVSNFSILLTRYNSSRNLDASVFRSLVENYGKKVLTTVIRQCVSLAEAPLSKSSILNYAPSCNGTIDYMAVTGELLSRWKQD